MTNDVEARLMSGDVGLPFFGRRVGVLPFSTVYVVADISSARLSPLLLESLPLEYHSGS